MFRNVVLFLLLVVAVQFAAAHALGRLAQAWLRPAAPASVPELR